MNNDKRAMKYDEKREMGQNFAKFESKILMNN